MPDRTPSFPPLSLCSLLFAALLALGIPIFQAAPSVAASDHTAPDHPAPGAHEVELAYYLPAGTDYDPAIPKPSDVLGFEVGEWHVRHDLLARYMETVAEASDRITAEVTGRTHEARPLMMLTLTSPANHARLEEIRRAHLRLSSGEGTQVDTSSMPVVVNMGYSVHGNEPSGANASLLLAYHLAAARDDWTRELLDKAVILLDPSLNPDGLSRFAQWANMHRGRVPVADPSHREHREHWPNGRTNHYWFDLNRDWLLAQHPESQARLRQFHHWRPNVLTDFHEMGTSATYFFQPGVTSRKNPLTPMRNVELTRAFAREHAEALDAIGSLYYTEETFDDFYYGKGSTYPDIHGAVGILFEQASSRGHVQETAQQATGEITFPFTIRNQLTTSLSTLRAALDQRQVLLDYQWDFYNESMKQGREAEPYAYIFGDAADPVRTRHLAELLLRHHIEVRGLKKSGVINGQRFEPGSAFAVPLAQPQYRLVRSLFETQKEFEDDTFYDVSTWTLPLAFGLPWQTTSEAVASERIGEPLEWVDWPAGRFAPSADAVAYAFEWSTYYAPRALYRLLDLGARARVAKQPFEAVTAGGATNGGNRAFPRGTIVVPMGIQGVDRQRIEAMLGRIAKEDGVDIHTLSSGHTPDGIDLGSPSLRVLERPRIGLLVGERTSTYDAGEVWHLLDHRFGMETSLLDTDRLRRVELDRYSHLVLVDGAADSLGKSEKEAISSWVRQGGVLLTVGSSAEWASEVVSPADDAVKKAATNGDDGPSPERKPYADYRGNVAKTLLSGSIFEVELDLTHPLAYGYVRPELPVFRTDRRVLPASDDPYATVAAYTAEPWISGYASEENVERLARTPALLADRVGDGTVVRIADNLNFRAYWYGTTKLFLNGLFFGGTLDRTGDEEPRDEQEHGH